MKQDEQFIEHEFTLTGAGGNNAKQVASASEGKIAIYTRDYGVRQGYFDIDPRPLQGDDIVVIESKISEIVRGN